MIIDRRSKSGIVRRILKSMAMLSALFLFIGIIINASSVALSPTPLQRSTRQKKTSKQNARTLFAQNCARCHAANGSGATVLGRVMSVPNMTDAEWQRSTSNSEMIAVITQGKERMPAFGKKLSKEQITALAGYVRTLKR